MTATAEAWLRHNGNVLHCTGTAMPVTLRAMWLGYLSDLDYQML